MCVKRRLLKIFLLIIVLDSAYPFIESTFYDCGPADRTFLFGNVTLPDTLFISSVPNIIPYGRLDVLEEGDSKDYIGFTILRNGHYLPCLLGSVGSCERRLSFWYRKYEKTTCHLFTQAGISCSDKIPRGTYELVNFGLLIPFEMFPRRLSTSKWLMSRFLNARYTVRMLIRDQHDRQRIKGCSIAEFDLRVAAN